MCLVDVPVMSHEHIFQLDVDVPIESRARGTKIPLSHRRIFLIKYEWKLRERSKNWSFIDADITSWGRLGKTR